jgi:dihydrofolate reductase
MARPVIYFAATSLDGYIARPDGGVDWLFQDGDYGMASFFAAVDTALMGRVTHDFGRSHGMPAFAGMRNYVFTRTLPPADPVDDPSVVYSDDLVATVRALRDEPGQAIWLVGGAQIAGPLAAAGLIDELVLSVHPIWLGDGIPLFPHGAPALLLRLRHSHAYETGLVQVHYDVVQRE